MSIVKCIRNSNTLEEDLITVIEGSIYNVTKVAFQSKSIEGEHPFWSRIAYQCLETGELSFHSCIVFQPETTKDHGLLLKQAYRFLHPIPEGTIDISSYTGVWFIDMWLTDHKGQFEDCYMKEVREYFLWGYTEARPEENEQNLKEWFDQNRHLFNDED
jgi:hypothetical protein